MTKEEIDQKIEQLRISSREIKGVQQQLAYLRELEKYHKLLKEKYGVTDEATSSRVAPDIGARAIGLRARSSRYIAHLASTPNASLYRVHSAIKPTAPISIFTPSARSKRRGFPAPQRKRSAGAGASASRPICS